MFQQNRFISLKNTLSVIAIQQQGVQKVTHLRKYFFYFKKFEIHFSEKILKKVLYLQNNFFIIKNITYYNKKLTIKKLQIDIFILII